MRINGLLCISSTTHPIKANDFDFEELQTYLFSQTSIHHRQNESCRLQLFLIGHTNELTVLFNSNSMIPVVLHDEQTYLQTLIAFDLESYEELNEIRFTKILGHACSQHDFCDRSFVFQFVQAFLISNNEQKLHESMVLLLYKKNPKQVRCLNEDRKLVKCAGDLCVSISWIYEKHFEYRCRVPPENGIKLYIDNHFIPDVAKKLLYKQRIQYICNYNQCNNQTIGNEVIRKVEQIYDISAIKRQLHIVDEQTTEQQASTTILFTTNSGTRPMKSRSAQQLMTIPIYFTVHLIEISFYHI
ncbi:unnamed protein product [Adineta ricciae]|nr:unnamed protein product [Adineta ricciae]